MSEAEIAVILAHVLLQLGSDAGQNVLNANGIGAIIQAFADAVSAIQPTVSSVVATSGDLSEVAPLLQHAGLTIPAQIDTSDGYAFVSMLGEIARADGYALLYIDEGSEDSRLFLAPQAIADQLLDLRSQDLADALGFPPGTPAKLFQQL